jgi:hypothetical protein
MGKGSKGWKNPKSAIAEEQRIYYNFVKPPQALDGKTPAEKVGIKNQGKDKWLKLFHKAINE